MAAMEKMWQREEEEGEEDQLGFGDLICFTKKKFDFF